MYKEASHGCLLSQVWKSQLGYPCARKLKLSGSLKAWSSLLIPWQSASGGSMTFLRRLRSQCWKPGDHLGGEGEVWGSLQGTEGKLHSSFPSRWVKCVISSSSYLICYRVCGCDSHLGSVFFFSKILQPCPKQYPWPRWVPFPQADVISELPQLTISESTEFYLCQYCIEVPYSTPIMSFPWKMFIYSWKFIPHMKAVTCFQKLKH